MCKQVIDRDGDAVRIDECVRHLLKEGQAFHEVRNHGLADPAKSQADHGDTQLHAVDDLVQIAMKAQENAGADSASLDQLLDAGIADGNQRKLCRGKEGVGRHQKKHQEHPKQHKGDHFL
jgi:hypothetical protein